MVKENNKGTAQGLRKSQGQGTDRKSTLSFIIPAPWPFTKQQQRSLAPSKEQEAILQEGKQRQGERKVPFSKRGYPFWMRLFPPKTCTRFV